MKHLRWIPLHQLTLAVVIVILYLTLLPKPLGEEEFHLFPGADKVVHACMFGGLTLTYIFERMRGHRPLTLRQALLAATVVSAFGIIIEFLQDGMNLGRSGDIMDAIADTVGAFAAVAVCYCLHWIDIVVKHRP
ncbi:MAG: VanZ family protein [Bacteroides sp.]|nr:VanZ family protein [Bacteroides sp.]